MKENLQNVARASLLFDFYKGLLGDKQKQVMELYHEENLSLAEIASELGMSRQAVHYTLKSAEESLEHYEEILELVEASKNNQKLLEQITEKLASCSIATEDREYILCLIKKIMR